MSTIVSFEGIPGSGKTTVLLMIQKKLTQMGYKVKVVDIDFTGLALKLHPLARKFPFGHPARVMMYWSLRLDQYDTVVKMSKTNDIVITDRFWDSTYVFDVCTGNAPKEAWDWCNNHIQRRPDLTFLFEAPLEVVSTRKAVEITAKQEVAKTVMLAYSDLARRSNWTVIDANRAVSTVADDCLRRISELCKQI